MPYTSLDNINSHSKLFVSSETGDLSLEAKMDELSLAAKHRSCTGVLASHLDSRDLHIHNLSILFHGAELLLDSTLEINVGQRYGLIGLNGCGN